MQTNQEGNRGQLAMGFCCTHSLFWPWVELESHKGGRGQHHSRCQLRPWSMHSTVSEGSNNPEDVAMDFYNLSIYGLLRFPSFLFLFFPLRLEFDTLCCLHPFPIFRRASFPKWQLNFRFIYWIPAILIITLAVGEKQRQWGGRLFLFFYLASNSHFPASLLFSSMACKQ